MTLNYPLSGIVLRYGLMIMLFVPAMLLAQEAPNAKFGRISEKDFSATEYEIDPSAAAVILLDKGRTEIIGNNKGWFSLRFYHLKRVHILKKTGYDAADIEIQLYRNSDGYDEELQNLKATTYNLENGKVVESKLERKAIFTDKKSKSTSVRKFTLPNVREGSIIEVEYNFVSDFIFNFQPWSFQGLYPRLWSEYTASIPAFMGYITLSQGYHPFHIRENTSNYKNFTVMDRSEGVRQEGTVLESNVTEYRWVQKDVPSLKSESYTSTLNNHISKIEFQLSEYKHPLVYRQIMGTWQQFSKRLMDNEDFAATLKKDNGWLNDAVKEATQKAGTDSEKAKAIYEFVRNNMTCTNYNGLYLSKSLKDVLKEKNGNVAEINLLLVAMLNKAGFYADPVMLSTRSHGYTYELYPLIDRFNYVICRLISGDDNFYLDASQPTLGFGKLSTESYNGHARIINEEATAVNLSSESLKENKLTIANLRSDDDGNITGSVTTNPGFYESLSIRNKIKEGGTDKIFTDLKKGFLSEVNLKNSHIDSITNYDVPVSLKYDLVFDKSDEDIIYFNPMLTEGWKANPFESAKRLYPVEMPYTVNETYLLNFQVPEGYEIDELPKQIAVKLNPENEGVFEYRLSHSAGVISLRSTLRINRAYFHPDEYETLREFFNLVVKKHNEQIVFKRKARP